MLRTESLHCCVRHSHLGPATSQAAQHSQECVLVGAHRLTAQIEQLLQRWQLLLRLLQDAQRGAQLLGERICMAIISQVIVFSAEGQLTYTLAASIHACTDLVAMPRCVDAS